MVFFVDILIYSKDEESHMRQLKEVFKLLRLNSLVVNKKKCNFGRRVEYLGHIVSVEGVSADLISWRLCTTGPILSPKDVKGLHGFLGLTGYNRRLVKGYGLMARPLTDLLKKDKFRQSATNRRESGVGS